MFVCRRLDGGVGFIGLDNEASKTASAGACAIAVAFRALDLIPKQEEEVRKKREEAKVQHKLWQMGVFRRLSLDQAVWRISICRW